MMTIGRQARSLLAAVAMIGVGCAGQPEEDGADDSVEAFTLRGWLEEGMYDLESDGGATGSLLVRKRLLGYEVSVTAVHGRVARLLLPDAQSVTTKDAEVVVTNDVIDCTIAIRRAEQGKVTVEQRGGCAETTPKFDGVFAPRAHAKVLGLYTDGRARLSITRSTTNELAFAFHTGDQSSGELTGEAAFANAFLASTSDINGKIFNSQYDKCKIGVENPAAPFRHITVFPTEGCRKFGYAERYDLDR